MLYEDVILQLTRDFQGNIFFEPWKFHFILWSSVDLFTFYYFVKLCNLIRETQLQRKHWMPFLVLFASYFGSFSVLYARDYFVIETFKLVLQYGVIFYVYLKNRKLFFQFIKTLANRYNSQRNAAI